MKPLRNTSLPPLCFVNKMITESTWKDIILDSTLIIFITQITTANVLAVYEQS